MFLKSFKGNNYKFDDEDWDLVEMNNWWPDTFGYLRASIDGGRYTFHRYIMDPKREYVVDHIDRDPKNNTRSNLRVTSRKVNSQNIAKYRGSTSKYKGVCYDKSLEFKNCERRYKAALARKHLGNYRTEEEAALAYNKAALEKYGKDAFQNIINMSPS